VRVARTDAGAGDTEDLSVVHAQVERVVYVRGPSARGALRAVVEDVTAQPLRDLGCDLAVLDVDPEDHRQVHRPLRVPVLDRDEITPDAAEQVRLVIEDQ